jgi:hypothetical protein
MGAGRSVQWRAVVEAAVGAGSGGVGGPSARALELLDAATDIGGEISADVLELGPRYFGPGLWTTVPFVMRRVTEACAGAGGAKAVRIFEPPGVGWSEAWDFTRAPPELPECSIWRMAKVALGGDVGRAGAAAVWTLFLPSVQEVLRAWTGLPRETEALVGYGLASADVLTTLRIWQLIGDTSQVKVDAGPGPVRLAQEAIREGRVRFPPSTLLGTAVFAQLQHLIARAGEAAWVEKPEESGRAHARGMMLPVDQTALLARIPRRAWSEVAPPLHFSQANGVVFVRGEAAAPQLLREERWRTLRALRELREVAATIDGQAALRPNGRVVSVVCMAAVVWLYVAIGTVVPSGAVHLLLAWAEASRARWPVEEGSTTPKRARDEETQQDAEPSAKRGTGRFGGRLQSAAAAVASFAELPSSKS